MPYKCWSFMSESCPMDLFDLILYFLGFVFEFFFVEQNSKLDMLIIDSEVKTILRFFNGVLTFDWEWSKVGFCLYTNVLNKQT